MRGPNWSVPAIGKINIRHYGHGVGTTDAHMESWQFAGGNGLMQTANYLALNPKALAHLLSQEVNLEVVNGYPAFIFLTGSVCSCIRGTTWYRAG